MKKSTKIVGVILALSILAGAVALPYYYYKGYCWTKKIISNVRGHQGPGKFVNKKLLRTKYSKALPEWARTQINEDLSSFKHFSEQDVNLAYKHLRTGYNRLAKVTISPTDVSIEYPKRAPSQDRRSKTMRNAFNFLREQNLIEPMDFILSFSDYLDFDLNINFLDASKLSKEEIDKEFHLFRKRFLLVKNKQTYILHDTVENNDKEIDIKILAQSIQDLIHRGFNKQPLDENQNNKLLTCLGQNGYIDDVQEILFVKSLPAIPFFTFAKDTSIPIENKAILIPDWMNLYAWPKLSPLISKANQHYNWNKKEDKLFWRGGVNDASNFRRKLVNMSADNYALVDAKFTEGNDKAPRVAPTEHLNYRYQIAIDGARGTWERIVWQLAANSTLLKPKSTHIQWFHKGIQPNVHYVEVNSAEDSVANALQDLQQNPQYAEKIANNGMVFANENLSIEDMFIYMANALNQYNETINHD